MQSPAAVAGRHDAVAALHRVHAREHLGFIRARVVVALCLRGARVCDQAAGGRRDRHWRGGVQENACVVDVL